MNPGNPETSKTVSKWCRIALLTMLFSACHKTTKDQPTIHQQVSAIVNAPAKATAPLVKKKKKKKIYLTFDDGPNRGTAKVLHISAEENIPISFFLVGEHVYASSHQREMFDSLQCSAQAECCNHSYTHALENHYERFYEDADTVVHDFNRCADSLRLSTRIGRTPGRNAWRTDSVNCTDLRKSITAIDSLRKAGYRLLGWDVEWHFDPKNLCAVLTADDIINEIDSSFAHHRTKTPDHLVLLAHDQVYADLSDSTELHNLIRKLKARDDYELDFVSNYPGTK